MSNSPIQAKKLIKRCVARHCKFNDDFPNGAPDVFNICPMCGENLQLTEERTSIPISNPKFEISSKPKENLGEPFPASFQSSCLKVMFRTIMVKSHFKHINGKITLRFNGTLFGNCKEDTTCLKQTGIVEHKGTGYVFLEGFVMIPQENIRTFQSGRSFGISYKYFLNGKEENPLLEDYFYRCLHIRVSNLQDIIYKYDYMVLWNEMEISIIDMNLWKISFNLLANNTLIKGKFFTFEEQLSTLQTISGSIFGSYFIPRNLRVKDGRINPEHFRPIPEIRDQEVDSVTQWIVSKIKKHKSSENLLKYLILLLLFFHNRELKEGYQNLLEEVLNKFTLDDIAYIISKKIFFSENFQDSELTIQNLQECFENIIFKNSYNISSTRIVITFLPLYHCMFKLSNQFEILQKQQEILANEYWGFPANTETKRFYNDEDVNYCESILTKMSQYDPILPYSIVLITISEENFQQFSSNNAIFQYLLPVLVYRMKTWPSDYTPKQLRCQIFSYLSSYLRKHHQFITESDLYLMCDSVYYLWEFDENFLNSDIVFLHLTLTASILQMLEDIRQNIISSNDSETFLGKTKHFKSSAELIFILIQKFASFLKIEDESILKIIIARLNVWDSLFSIQFPNTYDWQQVVEKQFLLTIQDMSETIQLQVFVHLSVNHKFETRIYTYFKYRIIDILSQEQDHASQENILLNLLDLPITPELIEILNVVYKQQKDFFEINPTLHILSWSPWLILFQFSLNGIEDSNYGIIQLVKDAGDVFIIIIQSLKQSNIQIKNLRHLFKDKEKFLSIIDTLTSRNILRQTELDRASIEDAIQDSKEKLDFLDEQTKLIHHFISILNFSTHLLESQEIKDFLKIDFESQPLNEICIGNLPIDYRILPNSILATNLNLPHIQRMLIASHHLKVSKIFLNIFKSLVLSKYDFSHAKIIDIKEVYDKVWHPAYLACEGLVTTLHNRKIPLEQVEKHFSIFREAKDKIKHEISCLSSAIQIMKLKSYSPNSNEEINDSASLIYKYFKFQESSKLAILIYQVHEQYCKEGDFLQLDTLVNLQNTRFIVENNLKIITDELEMIYAQLNNYDSLAKSLLETFVNHPKFVLWARITLKDSQQVKVFVDLALTSCGETDFNINRITCLRSVCNTLAPLIFDMRPNCSYGEFLILFNQVIDQIVDKDRFLNTFNEAANLLHIWKHLELAHSSVGKSTIQELADIFAVGYFEVNLDNHSDDGNIHLYIQDSTISRVYNLENLKDLQSKIALIKAESNATQQIELFTSLFEYITEISLLVEKLKYLGHISYVNYFKQFKCHTEAIPILLSEIKMGNEELNTWSFTLEFARHKFYSLNFYTDIQILILRRDLSLFQRENILNPQIIHLLSMLNPNVTKEDISKGLGNIPDSLPSEHTEIQPMVDSLHEEIVDSSGSLEPYPETFDDNDRKFCQSLLEEQDMDLTLCIIGIRRLKRDSNVYDETDLLEFCLNNTGLIESSSVEIEVDTTSGVDSKLDQSLHILIQQFDQKHISLEYLSIFLERIIMDKRTISRQLPNTCKPGQPNLMFVPNYEMIYFVLSQYLACEDVQSLPSNHELILCTSETSFDEIDIFFRRVILETDSKSLFCLLFIEKLGYETAVKSITHLNNYMSSVNNPKFKLLLLCSTESENTSYFASTMYKYKRVTPSSLDDNILKEGLLKRFSFQEDIVLNNYSCVQPACLVDTQKSRVRIVASHSVGAGKSLAINDLAIELKQMQNIDQDCSITIPLHRGNVIESDIVKCLLASEMAERQIPTFLFHFDVASTIIEEVIPFLFKVLILGTLKDTIGNVWSCKAVDYYTIEITLEPENCFLIRFCNLFPITICLQPKQSLQKMREKTVCSERTLSEKEFISQDHQRVYTYLHKKEMKQNLEDFYYSVENGVYGNPIQFLEIVLKYSGLDNPSWSELNNFIKYLGQQLLCCERNIYCQQSFLDHEWKGFRTFLINMIIPMSRDIATPSLSNTCESSCHDLLSGYSIQSRRRWEQKNLPYLYLNEDRQSMTFFGVQITKNLNLIDQFNPSKILEKKVVSKDLYLTLLRNRVDFQDNCMNWNKEKKISVLANVIGIEQIFGSNGEQVIRDPDPSYVLTLDNLKKILAIHMRFRCNIPVIIMGETGCGKTRLVYYMCQLQAQYVKRNNMRVLKVHGGITDQDIIEELTESIKLAQENVRYNIDTVLFFDEANTSHSIGLIKEILIDRRVNGNPIPNDIRLQFVAACNPYRRHSKLMFDKLLSAGLGKAKLNKEATERFGKIPLRELVYRVVELPKSLLPLVWDFGQLSREVEESYIREIIKGHLDNSPITLSADLLKRLTEILSLTQQYMRDRNDECSFVSLRDVERTMKVMLWFFDMIPIFVTNPTLDQISTSLLLSLSICYRARLNFRISYDCKLVESFKPPLSTLKDDSIIIDEIEKFQSAVANSMKVGEHIAKNSTLKENLFMMFVCIELRIPLYIIGKPGSSKSLAKAIVNNSMEGDGSRQDSKLRKFKRVEMLSYQCSQLSTSEGILNLFKTCKLIQSRENPKKFVSCVVLEEVGLAEDSPLLPLKVLHPLLEDDSAYVRKDNPDLEVDNNKVAFLGLSNWALDPAKMNRGIMVCLTDPYKEELILTAKAICESKQDDAIHAPNIIPFINGLVTAYLTLMKIQEKSIDVQYFGLRDFYSLIKMLYHICRKEDTPLNLSILRHAVERNFGGMEGLRPFEIFERHVYLSGDKDEGVGCSPLALIKANLSSHQGSFYTRNRYLLLLTENFAALDIIKHAQILKSDENRIIFGSSFPNDSEYSTICRNINLIKSYIETGKTLILTNLLNLYESLYDVLNQYYFESLDKFWVDIGLGTHRVKCSVHQDFKLIVIADSKTVCKHFPSALINRFEKHTLTVASVLSEEERAMAGNLSRWAEKFVKIDLSIDKKKYHVEDCIVGFQASTAHVMIYSLLGGLRLSENQPQYKTSIMELSKSTLLQMSTPDSVLRLSKTKLQGEANAILNTYLTLPLQDLQHYFQHIVKCSNYFSIITTHSMLLSESEVLDVENSLSESQFTVSLHFLYLLQFQTNLQFSNRINELLSQKSDGVNTIILIQCDNGNLHSDLISCARHHIIEQFEKLKPHESRSIFFVIVIRMSRKLNSLSSYCGGVWQTVHIDELRPPELTILPSFTDLIHLSLSEIFSGKTKAHELYPNLRVCFNQGTRLLATVQPAFSLLFERNGSHIRTLKRIEQFISLLHDSNFADVSTKICKIISNLLDNNSIPVYSKDWSRFAAFDEHLIHSAGTFRKALSKEIDIALIPLVAETLAYLDRNGNIELIFMHTKPAIQEIWKCIFIDQHSFFNHLQSISPRSSDMKWSVPIISDGWNGNFFQARFPFSWIIVSTINEVMNNMKMHSGNTEIFADFEEAFKKTIIGELISSVDIQFEDSTIACYYLDDFINLMIYPKDVSEHKAHFLLILNGVLDLKRLNVQGSSENLEMKGSEPNLIQLTIPMIHVVYDMLLDRIGFIKQASNLVFEGKDEIKNQIDLAIKNDTQGKLGQLIDSVIFEAIVKDCKPDLTIILTEVDWEFWVSKVRRCQPIIESNFKIVLLNQEKNRIIRTEWDSIQAILIFVTNFVLLTGYDMKASLKQFHRMIFTKDTNLHSEKTMKRIFAVLNALTRKINMDISEQLNIMCLKCKKPPADTIALACFHFRCRTCLPSIASDSKCPECIDDIYATVKGSEREHFVNICREMSEKQLEFRKQSTNFIMELLSSITFASFGNEGEENGLIEYLVSYIALDHSVLDNLPDSQSDNIMLFQEGILKPSPAVRLFLLQLLIKNRFHLLRNRLSEYMDITLSHLQLKQKTPAHEMLVIFVQCFEDYYHSKCFSLPTETLRIQYISALCHIDQRLEHFGPLYQSELSLAYIESVSLIRFVVLVICQWIIDKFDLKREAINLMIDQEETVQRIEQKKVQLVVNFKRLIKSFEDLSQSVKCSEYLHFFFMKALYSHLGWGGIKSILCVEELKGIIPLRCFQLGNFDGRLDLFASFGPLYQDARKVVRFLITEVDSQNLSNYMKEQNQKKESRIELQRSLVFALFTEIYMENLNSGHQILYPRKIQTFLKTIEEYYPTMPNELFELLEQLFVNKLFNGRIPELILTPNSHGYTPAIAGILCHIGILLHYSLGQEIENLLAPLTLIYMDPGKLCQKLFPTMENMEPSANFVKMVISEEGRWYECPNGHTYFIGECGKPWTASSCPECGITIGGSLHKLHNGNVEQKRYAGHILGCPSKRSQLKSGIRRLSATSASVIRALMHGIFIWASANKFYFDPTKLISLVEYPGNIHISQFFFQHMLIDIFDISNVTGKDFEESALIIHMVIDNITSDHENVLKIDTSLTSNVLRETWEFFFDRFFISPILSDVDKLLQNKLISVRNDVGMLNHAIFRSLYEKDINPAQPEGYLWRFRSKIDFQHFSKAFNSQGLVISVQYPLLGKFIQEEHLLAATKFLPAIVKLQIKLGQKKYKCINNIKSHHTIQFFLVKLQEEEGESVVEELRYLINELAAGWKLVGSEVIQRNGLRIQFSEIHSNITPIQFIMPTTKGEKSILVALTELLIDTHNSFIVEQKKYSIVQEYGQQAEDTISLPQLSKNHMIDYQAHLDKLILSNARYSLQFGEGAIVQYDFSNIERQLVDNFIRSKPIIIWDRSKPGYSLNNVANTMFQRIKELIPQEKLDEALAKRIINELANIENISEVLDLIEVVIGFAGSAGGFPNHKIKSYLHDVLKYPVGQHLQSDTANIYCCMKHLVWLWQNISVAKALLFVQHNQHPFASLSEHFYAQLSLEQNREFKAKLNLLPLKEILFALHDFVIFFLRNLDVTQAQYPLYDCFTEYFKLDFGKDPEFFPSKIFTGDILVSHTIHVWTILAQEV